MATAEDILDGEKLDAIWEGIIEQLDALDDDDDEEGQMPEQRMGSAGRTDRTLSKADEPSSM